MRATGITLKSRSYTELMPPASFEDVSRFRNNGAHTAITWVRLPSGLYVRSFNGTTSLVNCGSGVSLDDIIAFSFEAWIYALGWGEGTLGQVFSKVIRTLNISQAVTGLIFYQGFSTTAGQWQTGGISLNTWYHILLKYDRSAVGNNPSIFINGVSVAVAETSTPVGIASSDAAQDFTIGNNIATNRTHNGYIALPSLKGFLVPDELAPAHFEKERHWFGV